MDITGKIIFVSEPRSGVSKTSGSQWMTQDFVIETHDQYPRKCVFNVFGEDRLKQFNIQLNGEYTVSFDIDAHEYNGRWFNNIRAWRVVPQQQLRKRRMRLLLLHLLQRKPPLRLTTSWQAVRKRRPSILTRDKKGNLQTKT